MRVGRADGLGIGTTEIGVRQIRTIGVALGAAAMLWLAGGCKKPVEFAPPPPPEVSVARPIVRTLPQTLDYTGETRGVEEVKVRARVRGFIESRNIAGGEKVKAGDILFKIDAKPFEAAVAQAQAEVETNEARLRLAQLTLDRKQQSAAAQAISQFELDQAVADRDAARATLALSQARLQGAQNDLSYTDVRAPFDGRIDVRVANVGELVGDAGGPALCTIINDSVIYVRFDVPERVVLAMRKQFDYSTPDSGIPIYAGFANDPEGVYPFVGRYERSDAGISPTKGATTIEGVFDNADGRIMTGAFTRIRAVVGEETVTLVPDAAVGIDQMGRYVLSVDDKNTVERTPVTVGDTIGPMRKLTTPLPEGARVIVNGLQRARPGLTVKPVEVALPELRLPLGPGAAAAPTTAPTITPTPQP